LPLCYCDREIALDQIKCKFCGRANPNSLGAPKTSQSGSNTSKKASYSSASMREVRAESKRRQKQLQKQSQQRAEKSRAVSHQQDSNSVMTSLKSLNKIGFVASSVCILVSLFLFQSPGIYSTIAAYLWVPVFIYLAWMVFFFMRTITCPNCLSAKKSGLGSFQPRKFKSEVFDNTTFDGSENGWRSKADRNVSHTTHADRNGHHVGDSYTTSYSSRTIPIRIDYYTDYFTCRDCGGNWSNSYAREVDLA